MRPQTIKRLPFLLPHQRAFEIFVEQEIIGGQKRLVADLGPDHERHTADDPGGRMPLDPQPARKEQLAGPVQQEHQRDQQEQQESRTPRQEQGEKRQRQKGDQQDPSLRSEYQIGNGIQPRDPGEGRGYIFVFVPGLPDRTPAVRLQQ